MCVNELCVFVFARSLASNLPWETNTVFSTEYVQMAARASVLADSDQG